jgi:hypothetical protein
MLDFDNKCDKYNSEIIRDRAVGIATGYGLDD